MTKKNKIVLLVVAIIVAIVLIFTIVGTVSNNMYVGKIFANAGEKPIEPNYSEDYSGDSTKNVSAKNNAGAGWKKYAETGQLELYLKKDRAIKPNEVDGSIEKTGLERINIGVYDKRVKKLWTAIPDDKVTDYSQLSEPNAFAVQSLALFEFYNFDKSNNTEELTNVINQLKAESGGGDEIEIGLASDFGGSDQDEPLSSNATVSTIPNGIRVSYKFEQISLEFALDFKIDKDRFDVSVPDDQIKEQIEKFKEIKATRDNLNSKIVEIQKAVRSLEGLKGQLPDDNAEKGFKANIDNLNKAIHDLNNENTSGGDVMKKMFDIQDSLEQVQNNLSQVNDAKQYFDTIDKYLGEIKEIGNSMRRSQICGLYNVTPLPYFGAATNKEKGYMFYPDQTGAISYFDVRHPNVPDFYGDVYTNHMASLSTFYYGGDEDAERFTTVRMPVFGIKKQNSGLVAIITEGDDDARVSYLPSSEVRNINTVYGAFYFRSKTQNTNSEGAVTNYINLERNRAKRTIRYYFLTGENSSYSGMAVKYREHLEQYKLLNRSKLYDRAGTPMMFEFFMGYRTKGTSVLPEYRKLTTFDQSQTILEDLKKKGLDSAIVNYQGWSDAGASGDYSKLPDNDLNPEGSIGGTAGLKKVNDYAKKNNIVTTFTTDSIFAKDSDISPTDRDVATTKNYGGFTIFGEIPWDNNVKVYMFNPLVNYNKILSGVNKVKDFDGMSLTPSAAGFFIYDDYNPKMPFSRGMTKQLYTQAAAKAKETLPYSIYYPSNMYMTKTADMYLRMDDEDSKFLLSDEGVPFIQMVLHGSVLYSGEYFNNLYDVKEQTLKQIEYGYIPSYVLTNDEPNAKENWTDYLFSTQYKIWSNKIVQTYNDYKNNVGDLWKVKMTNHQRLPGNITKVTYANGAKIYLNYNAVPKAVEGISLPAYGYKVVR